MLPQRGKTRPNLDASSTRHVFISGKTCRDTCHTEMGGQVQPPLGVGSFNFPHWGLLLKLRTSRHFSVFTRPQIVGERFVHLAAVSLCLLSTYCNKKSSFRSAKTNYFSPIPSRSV